MKWGRTCLSSNDVEYSQFSQRSRFGSTEPPSWASKAANQRRTLVPASLGITRTFAAAASDWLILVPNSVAPSTRIETFGWTEYIYRENTGGRLGHDGIPPSCFGAGAGGAEAEALNHGAESMRWLHLARKVKPKMSARYSSPRRR